VEALTGALALALFLKFGLAPACIAYFVFSAALIVITSIDLDHQIIPNLISLPGIGVGFL
jgi:leader peptidase (prepilin peptidase)/N-methyltransferase